MRHKYASTLAMVSCAILFARPLVARAADYYVSPTGNDNNNGTSAATAWKTINKVNAQAFASGDRILFEGGQTFSGSLYFDSGDLGTPANPIVVSSYGNARATINAGMGDGIFAYNTAGLTLSNLIFVGAGAATNTKSGIGFYNDLPGNVKLGHIHVDNVEASGFRNGILIGGWNGTSGYDDIRVTNTLAHDNQRAGMSTYGQQLYSLTNVYVGYSKFYNNLGDTTLAQPSGNGVVLGEVDGGMIERTIAYGNGIKSKPGLGPVAIWTYNSNKVTIQYCEAYGNQTSGTTDGGGFDLDIAMTNSIMQYNYSHDNDGAGYGLYQGADSAPWANNVVRYNISENDGRKNNYGAITMWTNGASFSKCDIYGNTIFVGPSASGSPRAIRSNSVSSEFRFYNNIVVTTAGLPLIDMIPGQTGIVFQGNDYWTSGGAFTIAWMGTNYTSLANWTAATGQETINGTQVGKNVDPLLTAPGTGGLIGNTDNLGTLEAYKLLPGSPMIDAGENITALNPGPHDYYGNSIPQGTAFDIGAHESPSMSGSGGAGGMGGAASGGMGGMGGMGGASSSGGTGGGGAAGNGGNGTGGAAEGGAGGAGGSGSGNAGESSSCNCSLPGGDSHDWGRLSWITALGVAILVHRRRR